MAPSGSAAIIPKAIKVRIRVDIFIVFSFRVPRLQGAVFSFSYGYASCGVECGDIENERLPHGVALVYSLLCGNELARAGNLRAFRRMSIQHIVLLGTGVDQVECIVTMGINPLPSFTLQAGDAIGPIQKDAFRLNQQLNEVTARRQPACRFGLARALGLRRGNNGRDAR